MKKLKVLLSVLLSAMLVLSLVVPSMASDYVITVSKKDVQAGETYTAYKIFDLQYTADGEGNVNGGIYTATPAQKAWIDANITSGVVTFDMVDEDTFRTDINGNYYVKDVNAKQFAAELNDKLDVVGSGFSTVFPQAASATIAVDTCELDVGSAGYFFVTTTSGSLCNLDSTTPTASIEDKNEVVTVDKIIDETDVNDATEKENDAQIGDEIHFETTINIPANSESVVLHDKMDAGFTFSGTVTVTGGNITTGDYTFDADPTDDDCDFEISFTKAYLDGLTADVEITVTYSAVLNKDAEVVDQGTVNNETWVTYGANQETEVITTTTKTTYFNLFKYQGNDVALPGAEFELYRGSVADANKVKFVMDAQGNYRVADDVEIDDTEVTKVEKIVSTDKTIKIYGLDIDDKYYLKETKAPHGFNALQEPVEVDSTEMGIVAPVKILNEQGTILPSTGGTGTKVLFTVGGIMMVVAFVLITSKRRMAAEK